MLSQHVCLSLEQFPCRKWTAEATLRITKKMVALSVIKKFASFVCMSSALLCWTNRRLIRELIFLQAACDFRDAWWKPPPKETSTDQPDWRLVPGGRECDLQVRQEHRQATWIFPIWTSKPLTHAIIGRGAPWIDMAMVQGYQFDQRMGPGPGDYSTKRGCAWFPLVWCQGSFQIL